MAILVTTSISDRFPPLLVIEDFYDLRYPYTIDKLTHRDFKIFNQDEFERDITLIKWSLATKSNDLNLGFKTFLCIFDKMMDKHAPFMTIPGICQPEG